MYKDFQYAFDKTTGFGIYPSTSKEHNLTPQKTEALEGLTSLLSLCLVGKRLHIPHIIL